jgi:hypothetical protein
MQCWATVHSSKVSFIFFIIFFNYMGNYQSHSEVDNLKKLYSLTNSQLKMLEIRLKQENMYDDKLVSALMNKQRTLQGRVPPETFNNVSTFLKSMYKSPMQQQQPKPNFDSQEEKFKQDFIKEQKERERLFYEQQKARRAKYESALNSVSTALKIFQLNEDFDMNQLKHSYRKRSFKFHPDRPGRNAQKFQVVTKAYMSLLEDLKMRAPQKDFTELKQSSQDYIETQQPAMRPVQGSQKFDQQLFNKIYEENRLHKPEDDGYGKWMSDNELEEKDIEKNEIFSNNFNIKVFNSTFNTSVKKPEDQIVKYEGPQAQHSSMAQIAELGVDKIDNFGGNGFSDYREAHSQQRLIGEQEIKERQQFKTVEELESHRKNMVPLTIEEIRAIESRKKKDEEKELKRQENVSLHDNKEFDIYNRMNQRLIESDFFR